ncbi:ADP-ribosylglycohydrolase family protein [Comamonas thiooxydans]|uniref:ADP-ribosylglycohydrolase family protein n=1 Tax=Comamonas thiooxydans TaxID=363952 RepID=UPI0006A80A10|nr:ADP-ribosylglycohydrolase family protein [Comamonas thiooxydans]CUA99472.1 ADP-ribosylglycohydrolase [Comamonas thiooxydans]
MNAEKSRNSRRERTLRSALWAAYGDALGFITELGGSSVVAHRTGGSLSVSTTIPWRRLIGGRFGASVDLPAGTYSDDTQLRLATCRSIQADGYFDIESFAKVELPVWLSYALGAGLGSKSAATSLGHSSVTWYSNFFRTGKSVYVNGGGNGAAMRVQPHVWAAPDLLNSKSYLSAVVKNSIVTHGHVRAIAGALVHAESLAFVLREERLPRPDEWAYFETAIQLLPEIVAEDGDLSTFWLPAWEQESGFSLVEATARVSEEWYSDFLIVSKSRLETSEDYRKVAFDLGALNPDERGSGIKSAILSLCAAWAHRHMSPESALESVANFLESDTDTIATMAGALIGAVAKNEPTGNIQDAEYIREAAERLYEVSQKNNVVTRFTYPDSLYWQPPKTTLDVVGSENDKFVVAGLGEAEPLGDVYLTRQGDTSYQWFRLEFGQTILCKRRVKIRKFRSDEKVIKNVVEKLPAKESRDLFNNDSLESNVAEKFNFEEKSPSLDVATDIAIKSNFDPEIVGRYLLLLAQGESGIELSVAFAAIVAKAKIARKKRNL